MSTISNLVTALAAVAGIIVATVLGRKAVAVAAETVERASLDYAAGRADLITQARVNAFEAMAELKASMHVFWKEDPQTLLAADPKSVRATELIQQRNAAEIDAHRAMYRLQSAGERLREVLPTAQIVELVRSRTTDISDREIRGLRAPVGVDMPAILQLVRLYERGAMALYFALVVDGRYTDPKENSDLFKKEFIADLELEGGGVGKSGWLAQVQGWLSDQLAVISNQTTPEIIAINFVESFLDVQLANAVHEVTDSVLMESRAAVVVRA